MGTIAVGVMLVGWGVASVAVALWLRRRFQAERPLEPVSGSTTLPDDFEP